MVAGTPFISLLRFYVRGAGEEGDYPPATGGNNGL